MSLIEQVRLAFGYADDLPDALVSDWHAAGLPEKEWGSDADAVPAAVLLPIVLRPEPTVLFTCRADTLRRHAGQIAFPGGRIDPDDDGPVGAALREAMEEVALPPAEVEVVGLAEPYVTGTGYRIVPVIGLIPPDLPLVPAVGEVAGLFEAPLAHLIEPANQQLSLPEETGRPRAYYTIHWREHLIWGATAAMIVNFSRRLARISAST